jgi:hypothetical protein
MVSAFGTFAPIDGDGLEGWGDRSAPRFDVSRGALCDIDAADHNNRTVTSDVIATLAVPLLRQMLSTCIVDPALLGCDAKDAFGRFGRFDPIGSPLTHSFKVVNRGNGPAGLH